MCYLHEIVFRQFLQNNIIIIQTTQNKLNLSGQVTLRGSTDLDLAQVHRLHNSGLRGEEARVQASSGRWNDLAATSVATTLTHISTDNDTAFQCMEYYF